MKILTIKQTAIPLIGIMMAFVCGCGTVVYPITSFFRSPDHLHGVVIDQDGNSIPGAKIVFDEAEHVSHVPFLAFGPMMRFSRTRSRKTDASGSFSLPFKRRHLLLKTIEKDRYVFEPRVLPHNWGRRHNLDMQHLPQNGKFLMYDLSNVDTSSVSVASSQQFKFKTDGTDYYLDLLSGEITTSLTNGSDLLFSIKQVGNKTCLVTFLAVEGGLWATANQMPYAPKEDYIAGFSTLYRQCPPIHQ